MLESSSRRTPTGTLAVSPEAEAGGRLHSRSCGALGLPTSRASLAKAQELAQRAIGPHLMPLKPKAECGSDYWLYSTP